MPTVLCHVPRRGFLQGTNGKIEQVVLLIFHVILMKILQYLLGQILKMRRPVILDVLVCRHANLVNKIISIILIRSYSASTYNF